MYERGFYGGKFLPFHKGHQYCIQYAAQQCRELFVLFFHHCEEESELVKMVTDNDNLGMFRFENRENAVRSFCSGLANVRYVPMDCRIMHAKALKEGTDTWDAETEYVLKTVGEFQAVYSSEPDYQAYFERAYPWAEHILIDVPRKHVPISGTMIRGMKKKEAMEWVNDI